METLTKNYADAPDYIPCEWSRSARQPPRALRDVSLGPPACVQGVFRQDTVRVFKYFYCDGTDV